MYSNNRVHPINIENDQGGSMKLDVTKFTLRERKYAKTKIMLVNEFIERLKVSRLDDISIKNVCDTVEISEATFYNYFPKKVDLICFAINLLNLYFFHEVEKKEKNKYPLRMIEFIFKLVARNCSNSYLINEVAAVFTKEHIEPGVIDVTPLERFYAYPDIKDIENVSLVKIDTFFEKKIKAAIKVGQLPKRTDIQSAVVSLKAIFIGVPLALRSSKVISVENQYKKQLFLLWKGLANK